MHSSSAELTGARPSVILVREWEQQLSSSGCCGRIEGDFLSKPGGQPTFPERRAAVEAMGPPIAVCANGTATPSTFRSRIRAVSLR
jgi:hypothetical protein